jgi:hypothetical protein
LGDKVDAQKPGCERKLGGGEYGSLDQRSLKMTFVALIHFAVSNFAIAGMSTLGATKPLRPPHFEQGASALLFCAVLGEKSRQTETFLELDVVVSGSSHETVRRNSLTNLKA